MFLLGWLLAGLLLQGAHAIPVQDDHQQQPFHDLIKPRKLQGRFLHITDIHPDIFYEAGSNIEKACHRGSPKKKKHQAGYYGQPYSECDTPMRLVDFTFKTLEEDWVDEIDFVVWTGDNVRHDNDRKHPRTTKEIFDLNGVIADKMERTFARRGISVIPSIGNNDVWPHNIMEAGPNSITSHLSKAWSAFIPFPQRQVFLRGAYYSVEVVPNSLAIISLNTMYFYDSNKAVSGCNYGDGSDPGNLQFDWLAVQLEAYRTRGLKVWITGHVPPSSGNFYPECHVRYVELSLRYQDTILGHLYGHMNADHFFFVERDDLLLREDALSFNASADSTSSAKLSHAGLYDALIDGFAELPKRSNMDEDNFGVVNVSPPIVPNPYLPSFRVFSYNVTTSAESRPPDVSATENATTTGKDRHPRHGGSGSRFKKCKEKEHRDTWRCRLDQPWHSDSTAPSRANRLWTPLGYAQYIIPKLRKGTKAHEPVFKLEYATYAPSALLPSTPSNDSSGQHEASDEVMFQYPIPRRHLPPSLSEGRAEKSKLLPYRMADLTVGSWLKLAKKLGDPTKQKLRARFRDYMYLGAADDK